MSIEEATVLTPVQRFWRLLKPDKSEIRNVYFYSIFSGLVNLSVPLGIQAIVNLIQGGQVSTSWIVLVCFVVFGVALTGVLQIFQLRITENLQQRIFARAALDFAFRIPRIKLEKLNKYFAPELVNRFFDVISVQKGLSKILIDFTTAALHVIFGLILLSLYHPFFIVFSLVLVLLVMAILRYTANPGIRTSLEESKYKYKVLHWLEEIARSSTTFKLSGNTELPMRRTNGLVNEYLSSREKHFRVLVGQYSLMVVFKVVVATALLAIGGVLVIEQAMNIGQFVAAEIIIITIMNAVEKLIFSFETIFDVLTSLEKMGQVTDLELENTDGQNASESCSPKGLEISLQNVSFKYPNAAQNSFSNVSLVIKPGQRVIITGRNGAGKSSLLHVIAGLYEPTEGLLSYNGIPSAAIDLDSLRKCFGDSMRQELLFDGSLTENITMGREGVTSSKLKQLFEDLGIGNYMKHLPEGLATHIAPRGANLPASLIQRILLARGLAHNPKLLLLEDALENLDETSKKQIVKLILGIENQYTLVAVSSNVQMLKNADLILVMKGGNLIAKGTFDEVKSHLEEEVRNA